MITRISPNIISSRLAIVSLLGIISLGISCLAQDNPGASRPNFIIILADDLGYADLSMNGSKQIQTPNIDALAATGARFSQGYVSSAVCAPSRAGLLTGKNQVEFGFDNNLARNQTGFDPEYGGLPVGQTTLAAGLKNLGYTTGLIGKWHLGDKEQFHPLNRGFDEFWGYLGGGHDYFRWESDKEGTLAPIICNYKQPQPITYITDDKGNECVDFIRRHKDKPFFLYASFNAPHAPMQALEEDLALFNHISDPNRRTYAAMVHRLDINVGKIVEAVRAEGLAENTFIVFLSDNGGPADQNYSCNAPLNGQKGILLEGGIRVPFIAHWPGTINQGEGIDYPVSSLDLYPTFMRLAGGNIGDPGLSGVDLMPYLLEKVAGEPHETLMWRFTISAAILEGDYKLVRLPDRLPMLYYLPDDISEQNNLALDELEITQRLLKKLGAWDVTLPHPLFLEGAEWKKKQLDLYDGEYQLIQPPRDD